MDVYIGRDIDKEPVLFFKKDGRIGKQISTDDLNLIKMYGIADDAALYNSAIHAMPNPLYKISLPEFIKLLVESVEKAGVI